MQMVSEPHMSGRSTLLYGGVKHAKSPHTSTTTSINKILLLSCQAAFLPPDLFIYNDPISILTI